MLKLKPIKISDYTVAPSSILNIAVQSMAAKQTSIPVSQKDNTWIYVIVGALAAIGIGVVLHQIYKKTEIHVDDDYQTT